MNSSPASHDVTAPALQRVNLAPTNVRAWLRRVGMRALHSVLPDTDAPIVMPRSAVRHGASRTPGRRFHASIPDLMIAASLLVVMIPLFLLVFRQLYDDRIYPAIVIGDVSVGGLTLGQAEERIAHRAAEIENGLVAFSYGGRTWTPRLRDMGASVNLPEALADARDLGRDGDASSRLAFTGAILRADQHLPLQIDLDPDVLAEWFDTVDRDIGQPAVNATIGIDGTRVIVTPEATGTVVDREAAERLIRTAFVDLRPVSHTLPTRTQLPDITQDHLRVGQDTLETLLSSHVPVTSEDEEWTIEPAVISPHLVVETVINGGTPSVRISVDSEGLAATLRAAHAEQINTAPVDAVIGWDGEAVVLEPGQNGATLDASEFAERVATSFQAEHTPVNVPVVVTEPRVSGENLESLGIDTLLGQGDSNFSGGVEGRDENVRVATSYMNGTLVPPGGIFSFNDAIGEITYERGFEEALVVQGEGVGRDVGGGVCQVSTTIFRAAINAGMPITEWYPHTFRLPNYELDGWGPGFDASILQWGPDPAAWPDFEFENYTGSWILIESYTEYPHVYVNIYGSGDGRTVTIDAGELGGNAFTFTRVIHDANGSVLAERRFDSYFL